MKIRSGKTRFLNFFRQVFQWPPLERWLAEYVRDRKADRGISKLVPNPYQYATPSWRTFRRNGIEMKVDISDYVGHYLYFGFEDASQRKLFLLCTARANVLDVGANIGWTALHLAHRTTGRVIGFEPDPLNFSRCQYNLALNSLPNLTVLPIGLGRTAMQADLEVRTPDNRGGNRIAPQSTSHTALVNILPLDRVPEVCALPAIDLIKIDVEGYEMEVLAGGRELLVRHRPLLFIEVDDRNLRDQGSSAQALISFLEQLGYTHRDAATDRAIRSTDDFTNCHFDIIASPGS